METTNSTKLKNVVDLFEKITCKPEKFLSVQNNESDDARTVGKVLYDFMKQEEDGSTKNALPHLIIEDFDEEQIWQEIELQNEDKWSGFLSKVSGILNQKNGLNFPIQVKAYDLVNENTDDLINGDAESDNDSEKIPLKENYKSKNVKKKKKGSKKSTHQKSSTVDDNFFKLREMEAFLDAQDKLETRKTQQTKRKQKIKEDDSSEEEDEESIDLFADVDDGQEGENINYSDFFGDDSQGESSTDNMDRDGDEELEMSEQEYQNEDTSVEKSESEIDLNGKSDTRKVRFSLPQSSSDDEDTSGDDSKGDDDSENLTEFQKRQQRLKKKIGHIENSMLEEKPWTMKGEVTGSTRPQNSLLEEVVDFDITSRPAPIITEETTMKLQDIIIQRIKDKTWDDVVRKVKPVQDVREFKKELVLDQEKSKLSLAQVYEQDYIKQREALDPNADEKPEEVPKEHVEIKTLMTSLFAKLDALTNFHYTPKMINPEVKIVSNIPAVAMEEVAPVATSDAILLAPEEVKGKLKGDIIGKSERTDTDKRRERRQKKTRQREREKERQKKEKLLDKTRPGLGNKYSREKASKLLDKVTKERNVDKMETLGDGKSIKSSKAFFTQLQDEVTASIKTKVKLYNKKSKNVLSAKKVKL